MSSAIFGMVCSLKAEPELALFRERIDGFRPLGDAICWVMTTRDPPRPDITLYGAPYSVYTRIARLVLAEKGLEYRLEEVDVFGEHRQSAAHLERHPFMRIPAIRIDGDALYETSAIARYLDDRFSLPPLQPSTALERSRMNQMISIMDNYAFRGIVWGVFVERVRKPVADEAVVAAGLDTAARVIDEMTRSLAINPWLAAATMSLADVWAAPMFSLFDLAPEGRAAVDRAPSVRRWLDTFNQRPTALQTRFPVEGAHS